MGYDTICLTDVPNKRKSGMSYSVDGLRELEKRFLELREGSNDLILRYLERKFVNSKAREFAQHGLCRRLRLMLRCIEKVFEILPPDTQEVPEEDIIHDVTVHLQAFLFNTYGCLDNLAHIWVWEMNVKGKDGQFIRRERIGFGDQNREVLASLPETFTNCLSEIRDWRKDLENFRHALAHRIPLYIPPGYLIGEKAEEYHQLQRQINEAASKPDFETVDQLEEEQSALLSFHPIATHSFEEDPKIMFFHPQMLNDFHIVQEIASKLLSCFD